MRELTAVEIERADGGAVDWGAAAVFAGRAAGIGVRLGLWGLAGAGVAALAYVVVDAID